MTDKQIIIDGVDVSGCSYYQHNMCTATKDDYGDCSLCCQDYDMNDCYYKQLKRKEQECEKLKEAIDGLLKMQYQLADSCTKYEQTLAEIKEIAETATKCFYATKSDDYTDGYRWLGNIILQKISECEVKNENIRNL